MTDFGDGTDIGYNAAGTLIMSGGTLNCGTNSGPNLNLGFNSGGSALPPSATTPSSPPALSGSATTAPVR